MEAAHDVDFYLGHMASETLVTIISQTQRKGLMWWDPNYIPRCIDLRDLRQGSDGSGETEDLEASNTDGNQPTKLENFVSKFKRYSIPMLGEWYGKRLIQNLSIV